MNYLKESVRHALAAEYVLGTLRGPARRRFKKLLMQHRLAKESVWMWERYLNELGQSVPEKEPSPIVWQQIEQRLEFTSETSASNQKRKSKNRDRSSLWRTLFALASAAALVMALVWTLSVPSTTYPVSRIAVVSDEDANVMWLIEVSPQTTQIRTTTGLTRRPDKDFELWMLPANGNAPVSLGLLPEDKEKLIDTPPPLISSDISALAVSLEPPGGSTGGRPAELLYVAELFGV